MGHETNLEIRVPPQNLDAEKAVLGAMMISEEAIGIAIEHLDGFYFYETRHQKIYEAVKDLYASRTNVDLITLSDFLKNKALFDSVGGLSYLSELADFVPTAANVKYYIDIVKEKGIQR
ncbi:MAG: replicative DNA helicase, partial [Candidatus Omnitrophica bacterium]|nr:replicative DNA helicase [Candidatus Omnitrophota bacterium]